MITYLVIAVLFSSGNPESALRTLNVTEETAAAWVVVVAFISGKLYKKMKV